MKTEVYSWRLSSDLKAELEAEARRQKKSVSVLLSEFAQRGLRRTRKLRENDEAEQAKIWARVKECIGTAPGLGPGDNKSVHEAVVENLMRKYERNRPDRHKRYRRAS